jgi:hypothetical protein
MRNSRYFVQSNQSLEIPDYRFFSYYEDDMVGNEFDKWKSHKCSYLSARVDDSIISSNTGTAPQPDWNAVAVDMNNRFQGLNYTPRECACMYYNELDPTLNKGPWLKDEDFKLKALAEKHGRHNWFAIAMELNANRTPLMCLKRYQQSLNSTLQKGNLPWSKEEVEIISQFKATRGNTSKVDPAEFLPGRSVTQIVNKFAKVIASREGKWESIEDKKLFLAAIAYDAPTSQRNNYKAELAAATACLTAAMATSEP